jgi:putative hydrolase of the HAD superfamily
MRKIKQIIFDADDTLWENNIYYLKATNDFFDLAEKEGISRSQAEKAFDELELKVVNELGYGSSNFIFILEELYRKFKISGEVNEKKLNAIIEKFNSHKLNKPKLIEYVTELMEQLSHKYKLYILTKGDPHEQESKIIKSGLSKMVVKYFILDEKDDKAYAQLLSAQNWQPNETCMIGNSPKSDINPALRNNMYAIHIPYKNTWKVDIEPIINKNGKYIKINNFEELKNIFLFE